MKNVQMNNHRPIEMWRLEGGRCFAVEPHQFSHIFMKLSEAIGGTQGVPLINCIRLFDGIPTYISGDTLVYIVDELTLE